MKALKNCNGSRIAGCDQKLKARVECPRCEQKAQKNGFVSQFQHSGYRIRIANLPADMSEEELSDIGSDWGTVAITSVRSLDDRASGKLIYDQVDEAMKALVHLYGHKIAGCTEKVKAH